MKMRAIVGTLALSLLAACGTQPPPADVPLQPLEHNTRPAVRLSDGSVFVLNRQAEVKEAQDYYKLLLEEQQAPTALLRPASLPARADLRANQTPIRNQVGRATCTSFANTALIEAFYKKTYGLSLDLSEQYANHVQKMGTLIYPSPTAANRENGLGMWGGGGVGWGLEHLKTYRLTEEGLLPYIPDGNYENTEQSGDDPYAKWYEGTYAQRYFGDFNLSDRPTAYRFPDPRSLAGLPQGALNRAVYGPVRVQYATEAQLRSVEWFKSQLAAGREVAFAVGLTTPDPCQVCDADGKNCRPLPAGDPCYARQRREAEEQFRGGIWRPLPTFWGGHAMLMVGYDDARQAFIVKNSWGRDGAGRGQPAQADADADGFIEMSYDWVSSGRVYEGAVLLEARAPETFVQTSPTAFLGRWKMDHDGWRGTFDLYHMPGTVASRWLEGRSDWRLGTYYGPDGVARRVNGYVAGNRLEFWIDWDTPDRAVNELRGMRFTGYLLNGNRHLAGTLLDNRDGRTYGFYLTKEEHFSGSGVPGAVGLASHKGRWIVNDNGTLGRLDVSDVLSGSGALVARYALGGSEYAVTGNVDPADPRRISFQVSFPGGTKRFEGYMFSWETGIIAGFVNANAGFYAYREGKIPLRLTITSPRDGGTYSWRQTLAMSALVENAEGELSVRWSSDRDGNLGSGSELRLSTLSLGTHRITATATAGSETVSRSVSITIQNDRPTLRILEPFASQTYCAGQPITFKADSFDPNNPPDYRLPDSAIAWRSTPAGLSGTGHTYSQALPAGGYTVIVRGTDELGEYGEASVNLNVVTCTNAKPTATILSPKADLEVWAEGSDAHGWYYELDLAGSATDPEDGTLSGSSLKWSTSLASVQPGGSGELGSGNNLRVKLYTNYCASPAQYEHLITLTAQDSGGQIGTATVRVRVKLLC